MADDITPQQESSDGQQHNKDTTTASGLATQHEVPFLSKLANASYLYTLKSMVLSAYWFRGWKEHFQPPEGHPDIVKTYECRPDLPIRIFFPTSYDKTSPRTLPTLFTIHGGGWCIGESRDDDEWNRAFADEHQALVISLNYAKAPGSPFPNPIYDVQALMLAALADESLPIDRTSRGGRGKTAVLGFSAGANLSLAVSQLPDVKHHPNSPAAAIPVYGVLDLSVPISVKIKNRPYKPSLPTPRNSPTDYLEGMAAAFNWGYILPGHDLRDPKLSPYYAERGDLPEWLCFVGAELDMLGYDSWRAACKFSGRKIPDRFSEDKKESVCGDEEAGGPGLKFGDERFAFEENGEGKKVKWLLVPDVLHGFDNEGLRGFVGGSEETKVDARNKEAEVRKVLGGWLKETVWV